MLNKKCIQKKSNSNPFRSLFEVECFLRNMSKLKNAICIKNNIKKLNK